MINLCSRYVAGWMIVERECGELDKRFIAQIMDKEGIRPHQATIFSGLGSPMTCGGVFDLLEEFGIEPPLLVSSFAMIT